MLCAAVKSHFRTSNNVAIKTREVRQKISSQWGSLNVHLRVSSRFFVQAGHQTAYASSGNHNIFTISGHCQNYQNY
jgi:hypothetical protein